MIHVHEEDRLLALGGYGAKMIEESCEETMDLWSDGGLWDKVEYQAFSDQKAGEFDLEACGKLLTFQQTPASQIGLGETGFVLWDGGIIMAKFLEHQTEKGRIDLRGSRCVDIGAGCGVVGCVAAALNPGGVVITDRFPLLKLIRGNVAENNLKAEVKELEWGQDYSDFVPPALDYVLGADIVFNENVLPDLVHCLVGLCGPDTLALIANELRCPDVHGEWLDLCMEHFDLVRVPTDFHHPDFANPRIVIYAMRLKRDSSSAVPEGL